MSVANSEYIYTLTCLANNKVYVGRTCNTKRRKREHFKKLSNNAHVNKNLQYSFNKYGGSLFVFSVIEETTPEYVKDRELFWFNKMIDDGVVLFNHNITSSDGGVDSKSNFTRGFIFEALDDKYTNQLTIEKFCAKYKISSATYYVYLEEWEDMRGVKMPRSVQQSGCLRRIEAFVEDFKKIGRDAYRDLKSYGLSHQALCKHLPKFGLSFDDVRLDETFKTTRIRAEAAIVEYESGKTLAEVLHRYNISHTTFYKYLKEQKCHT